jgi:hypothetical protein
LVFRAHSFRTFSSSFGVFSKVANDFGNLLLIDARVVVEQAIFDIDLAAPPLHNRIAPPVTDDAGV